MQLTFDYCKEIIDAQLKRGFDKKKLANNTYLRKLDERHYAVTLHRTDVVVIFERDNRTVYRLNCAGYQTVTSKDRLNTFSPARIYQKRGVWYLSLNLEDSKQDAIYFDGIEVDEQGKPINTDSAPVAFIDKKKQLDKLISEYIRGFAKDAVDNGLGKPDAGDCLICRFYADNHESDDLEHVYAHLQEKYYTRTLLWYCLKMHGYSDPAFIWCMMQSECERGGDAWIKRELRYALGKMKSRLSAFVELDSKQLVAA